MVVDWSLPPQFDDHLEKDHVIEITKVYSPSKEDQVEWNPLSEHRDPSSNDLKEDNDRNQCDGTPDTEEGCQGCESNNRGPTTIKEHGRSRI